MFRQKKLSLGARFGLSVASFLLGLLLFVSILATTLIIDIRVATSENTILEIVQVLLSSPSQSRDKIPEPSAKDGARMVTGPVQADQAVQEDEPDAVAEDLTQQLIDMLYEELGPQLEEDMPVSLEEFTALINESTAKDYIADKTASLITDYFNDEITTTFEKEEILVLIEENQELIETIVGEPLPEDVAQKVATVFNENSIVQKVEAEGLRGFMELMNSAEGEGDSSGLGILDILDTVAKTTRTLSSNSYLLTGIGICVVLMAAIILINCRQIGKGLRRVGYSFLPVGLFGLGLCILVQYIPVAGDLAALLPVVQKFFDAFIPVYAVTLGIGAAFVVSGIVLPIVLRVKRLVPVGIAVTAEPAAPAAVIVDEIPLEITEAPAAEAVEEVLTEEAPVSE